MKVDGYADTDYLAPMVGTSFLAKTGDKTLVSVTLLCNIIVARDCWSSMRTNNNGELSFDYAWTH